MRIISRRPLRDFSKKHPDSRAPLEAWFAEAKRASWKTPAEVKALFRSASFVGKDRVVFNIGGNKYRLVVQVRYDLQIIFVRFIGTHAQYDRVEVESI